MRLIQPGPELMSRLLNLHKTAGHIAKTDPHIFALPEAVRALEQELIHVMVRCATEGTSTKMTDGVRRHDMIVVRFEEFLEANPNTPLYLSEICTALGTAERTLRIACEEHLGMGPIRYLTLRRMHLARRVLLQADASTATVTKIATDLGFWELGRFAVVYRKNVWRNAVGNFATTSRRPSNISEPPSDKSNVFGRNRIARRKQLR